MIQLRKKWFVLLTATLALAALAGPAWAASSLPNGRPWISTIEVDHPLVGRIWRSRDGSFVSPEEFLTDLAKEQAVLLGEKHPNPDHHEIQAWIIGELTARGKRPAVVFEMLRTDQQAALDAHLKKNPKDAAGIGAALAWDESGWPDWQMYQPVFEAAVAGGGPLLAASWPRTRLREIAKEGVAVLGMARVQALDLARERPAEQIEQLRLELVESHCGQLPDSMITPMIQVTAAKDALMTEALHRGVTETGSAVLIAGAGHVRADLAVPWHLEGQAPELSHATLGAAGGNRRFPGAVAILGTVRCGGTALRLHLVHPPHRRSRPL